MLSPRGDSLFRFLVITAGGSLRIALLQPSSNLNLPYESTTPNRFRQITIFYGFGITNVDIRYTKRSIFRLPSRVIGCPGTPIAYLSPTDWTYSSFPVLLEFGVWLASYSPSSLGWYTCSHKAISFCVFVYVLKRAKIFFMSYYNKSGVSNRGGVWGYNIGAEVFKN